MPPVPDRAALAPATPATRLLCLIVCLVVALLAPSPVAAQSATPTPDPALKAAAEQIFAQARTLYEAGDVAGARAALLSALEFYRLAPDADGQAAALLSLALLERAAGAYAEALAYYDQALAVGLSSPQFEASVLLGIGDVQALLKESEPAIDAYTRAIDLLRNSSDKATLRIALTALGNAYHAIGRYPEAVGALNEALALARELADRGAESRVLAALGAAHLAAGQPAAALRFFEEGAALARRQADRASEQIFLAMMGTAAGRSGDPAAALAHAREALVIARDLGDRSGEAVLLYDAGYALERGERYAEALAAYRDSLALEQALGNRLREALALHAIGIVSERLGRNAEALAAYESALAAARAAPSRETEGMVLNDLGLLYDALSRRDEGRRAVEQALAVARELGDRRSEGRTLNNLGSLVGRRGAYAEAQALQEQALGIFRALPSRADEAITLNNIALNLDSQGRYAEAAPLYQQALAIHRELGDRAGEAAVLENLAGQDEAQGRYGQALERYQQALDDFRAASLPAQEAVALSNLAGIFLTLGQPTRALEIAEQALALRRSLGDRAGEGITLGNLAAIHLEMGEYEQALEAYGQALSIAREIGDRPDEAALLDNSGIALAEMGRYDEALEAHAGALAIHRALGNRAGEAISLAAVGAVETYRALYDAAIASLEQALAIYREQGDVPGEAVVLSNIGYALREQGRLREALDAYTASMANRERLRAAVSAEELRTSLTAGWRYVYEAAAQLQLELGAPQDAFGTAERARARTFLDQLAGARVDVRQGADAELLAREQVLRAELARLDGALRRERVKPSAQRSAELARVLSDEMAARQREYDDLLLRIKLSSPAYAAMVSAEPLSLADTQKLLGPDVTLVSYYLMQEKAIAFVVGRDVFETFELPVSSDEVRRAVLEFRQSFAMLDDPAPPSLDRLSQWLIAPLRHRLSTPVLGIVPHDALHYLPFAAVPGLAGDFVLFTLPSASVLPHVRTQQEPAAGELQPLLAIAQGQAEGLPPLRYAEEEAEKIAALFSARSLAGDAATESALKVLAPGARYIHIAAHGQLNTAAPLFSRLVLAADEANDGSLEVHEVYGLDLSHAGLVTLSACQTQLGAQSDGDDIIGLGRAFLYAGAPAVIASLWSVDDEATAALMTALYRDLKRGMGPAQALRAAQASVRDDEAHPQWRHPYYWAAFVLTGDPGSVAVAGKSWERCLPWAAGGAAVLAAGASAALAVRRTRRRRVGTRAAE